MANINQASEGENLSRIRDILFGEELQGIEQKLGAAKDDNINVVEKLKQEIADLKGTINNNKEQFDVKLANIENAANQTINQLKKDYELIINDLKNTKVDKNSLADMLNDLAENLKK